ncbi:hypothetical protein Bequi_06230 [Brachybacterium sp. JHP9]|uniref:Uncharacterized protein n=1 Tax=Brachybacterium equifaecis TaxID=2910770 RepID=A0ABT0R145_9MICO|nr:hypothetical protein [Brachybacterium equifaecis]MCL6422989.1 hypothetical protein [Brachybacterium equifaecis]
MSTTPAQGAPALRPRLAARAFGRPGRAALATIAAGALTLVDPRSLTPVQQAARRLAEAALAGFVVADTGEDPIIDPTADGLLTASIVLGLSDLSDALDTRVTSELRRAGVGGPRLVMGSLAVVAVGCLYALSCHAKPEDEEQGPSTESFDAPDLAPLPPAARALTAALLGLRGEGADGSAGHADGTAAVQSDATATAADGSEVHAGSSVSPGDAAREALREQLESARCLHLGQQGPDVVFAVEHPRRLAVPHHQVWPQRARFTSEGFRYEALLQIAEGRLAALAVQLAPDEDRIEDALEALVGADLPRPDEVELIADSALPPE